MIILHEKVFQLVDFMNDQIVDAIVEENSTVFTNKTANETIVIVEDKVTLVNETEGSKGQIISEEEEANEIELEGVFDPSKVRNNLWNKKLTFESFA